MSANEETQGDAVTLVKEPNTEVDLKSVSLTDVALAPFGDWKSVVEAADKGLAGVHHDLSTQSKVDEAKSLRWRLIGQPAADFKKIGKAVRQKLGQAKTAVTEREELIVAELEKRYVHINPQIEAAERVLEEKRLERERQAELERQAEAERVAAIRARIDRLASIPVAAADMGSSELAVVIEDLHQYVVTDERFAEFKAEADAVLAASIAATQKLLDKAVEREQEEARRAAEAARLAEEARKLAEERAELERMRQELEAERERARVIAAEAARAEREKADREEAARQEQLRKQQDAFQEERDRALQALEEQRQNALAAAREAAQAARAAEAQAAAAKPAGKPAPAAPAPAQEEQRTIDPVAERDFFPAETPAEPGVSAEEKAQVIEPAAPAVQERVSPTDLEVVYCVAERFNVTATEALEMIARIDVESAHAELVSA